MTASTAIATETPAASPELTSKFRDASGREWDLRITLGTANRLRDAGIVDLLTLFKDGMKAWEEFLRSPGLVSRAVVCICAKQGEAANLSPSDLDENLDGRAINSMITALQVAVADFFQGSLNNLILAGLKKGRELQAATEAKALQALKNWDPNKVADAAASRVAQELDALGEKLKTSQAGPSSSPSGPAPSASTPNP
jgi:hypothetical protein